MLSYNYGDLYKDIHNDAAMFDFSDYPKQRLCYSVENKKIIGKFKDELSGVPITEFVGVRAKMYSLIDKHGRETKRAKGVKKNVVAHHIRHEMYKTVLFAGSFLRHIMRYIRCDECNISTVEQNKMRLSAFDDKNT